MMVCIFIIAVVALAAPTFTRALPAKPSDLASLSPQHHSEPETLLGKPYVVHGGLVQPVDVSRDLKAVLSGHERYDGGGIFPNGLLGRSARFQLTQSKRTILAGEVGRDVDVFSNQSIQPSSQSLTLTTPSASTALPQFHTSPAHVE
jgi:hypothetical protein